MSFESNQNLGMLRNILKFTIVKNSWPFNSYMYISGSCEYNLNINGVNRSDFLMQNIFNFRIRGKVSGFKHLSKTISVVKHNPSVRTIHPHQ